MQKLSRMFVATLFVAAAVMVNGCGGDKDKKDDKGADEKKTSQKSDSAAVAKKDTKKDAASKAVADKNVPAKKADDGKMVAVSINLPGMT